MLPYFHPGDVVVYRKHKSSVHPGPRAKDIFPAPAGDFYSYAVDKFWRVVAVLPNDMLIVRSRRGKEHRIAAQDPALRKPHWWEKLLYHRRFPPYAITESHQVSHQDWPNELHQSSPRDPEETHL